MASFYPSTQFWNLSFPRQWRTCCPLNPDSIHRLFSPAPFSLSCSSISSLSLSVFLSQWKAGAGGGCGLDGCPALLPLAESLHQRTHGHCSAAAHEIKQRTGTFSILLVHFVVLGPEFVDENYYVSMYILHNEIFEINLFTADKSPDTFQHKTFIRACMSCLFL